MLICVNSLQFALVFVQYSTVHSTNYCVEASSSKMVDAEQVISSLFCVAKSSTILWLHALSDSHVYSWSIKKLMVTEIAISVTSFGFGDLHLV